MLPVRKRLLCSLVMTVALGCGRAPAVRYAQSGDFPALKKELDERAAKNDLDDGDMRAVSRAILEHDLKRFAGDEGIRRLSALTVCAKPIASALEATARGDDDLAATAAWVLVDSGVADKDAFTDAHRDDKRPRWRAVATRGLFDAGEASLRAERANDDDEHVRRAAVAAAGDAGCASDFPLLLEAARRDPIAIVQVDAVRALASIAPKLEEGSPRADLVDRLNDLWTTGDDAMRGALARALAVPVLFDAGGRQVLDRVLGRDEGHASVDAASAMMGAGGQNGALMLARLANNNDPAVRTHALRLLEPRRPEHAEVLLGVLQSKSPADDPSIKVVAAEALLHAPAHAPRAIEALLGLMGRPDKVGTDAAIALASASDLRAKPRLIADLATPSSLRFRVASALVRLGAPGEVRPLLASTDIDVRDGAACAVLSTPKN